MSGPRLEEFKNPGSEYRGAPFWAWNGPLEPEEIRRQVRDMGEHGMGGFFMHSRTGLATAYLSREWMECVKAAVEEAETLGMKAWIYDEDRWPSGAAGGIVTEFHPEYRLQGLLWLVVSKARDFMPDPLALRTFTAKRDGDKLSDVSPLDPGAESVPEGTEAHVFSLGTAKSSGWYNDGAYVNTLDREAVEKFLDVTLEPYRRWVGGRFGGVVPGVFTDEPNFGSHWPGTNFWAPWTRKLPEVFKDRYGYDILDRLPELFLDVEGRDSFKLRRDYWDCVTYLFVEGFSRPYAERCREMGLVFTGHYLAEQTMAVQTRVVGAAMRHYEHMDMPGIDILTESIREVLTCKQCSSVAGQLGLERLLSELYGCSGWDFSFEGEKWVGDWQIALGVNYRCQHLTWYTMAGNGKRDYPPTFHYQSASWKYHKPTEDYFARLCHMTSVGSPERNVLLIHPIESAWGLLRVGDHRGCAELDEALSATMRALLENHFDFDFGDEDLMTRHGSVEGGELRVGKMNYKAVVLPRALTLRSSTVGLLERFLDSGGKVVAVRPIPERLDAEPAAERLGGLFSREGVAVVENEKEALSAALEAAGARSVSVSDSDGEVAPVLVQRRRDGERTTLLLVNTDRENSCEAEVRLSGAEGGVEEWDLWTGRTRRVGSERAGGSVRFRALLHPVGSRLFVIDPAVEGTVTPEAGLVEVGRKKLPARWEFERDDLNARILDRCQYRTDGGAWSGEKLLFVAEQEMRRLADLGGNRAGETQPWKRTLFGARKTGLRAELRFRFRVRNLPRGRAWLVMERPEDFEIELNGKKVGSDPEGWWMDRAFKKLDVKKKLKTGRNELLLRTEMREDSALEQLYIAGDFGVKTGALDIVAEPAALKTGSWTEQGYAQYPGSMTLKQKVNLKKQDGERLFLAVGRHAAVCLRVWVNGKDAGLIPWPPYEVEITDLVKNGSNSVAIELVGSRRNLLGPLHCKEEPAWHGPTTMEPPPGQRTDEYRLVPAGLLEGADIVTRREETA